MKIEDEDELRRSTRKQHFQIYQNYVDSLETSGKNNTDMPKTGRMKGKTIKHISGDESAIKGIFNHFSQNINPHRK